MERKLRRYQPASQSGFEIAEGTGSRRITEEQQRIVGRQCGTPSSNRLRGLGNDGLDRSRLRQRHGADIIRRHRLIDQVSGNGITPKLIETPQPVSVVAHYSVRLDFFAAFSTACSRAFFSINSRRSFWSYALSSKLLVGGIAP
jgi:hypothetical protein